MKQFHFFAIKLVTLVCCVYCSDLCKLFCIICREVAFRFLVLLSCQRVQCAWNEWRVKTFVSHSFLPNLMTGSLYRWFKMWCVIVWLYFVADFSLWQLKSKYWNFWIVGWKRCLMATSWQKQILDIPRTLVLIFGHLYSLPKPYRMIKSDKLVATSQIEQTREAHFCKPLFPVSSTIDHLQQWPCVSSIQV